MDGLFIHPKPNIFRLVKDDIFIITESRFIYFLEDWAEENMFENRLFHSRDIRKGPRRDSVQSVAAAAG